MGLILAAPSKRERERERERGDLREPEEWADSLSGLTEGLTEEGLVEEGLVEEGMTADRDTISVPLPDSIFSSREGEERLG